MYDLKKPEFVAKCLMQALTGVVVWPNISFKCVANFSISKC